MIFKLCSLQGKTTDDSSTAGLKAGFRLSILLGVRSVQVDPVILCRMGMCWRVEILSYPFGCAYRGRKGLSLGVLSSKLAYLDGRLSFYPFRCLQDNLTPHHLSGVFLPHPVLT